MYSLVGVYGNAMKRSGLKDQVDQMLKEAKSGDYYHLIAVCNEYVEKCNQMEG